MLINVGLKEFNIFWPSTGKILGTWAKNLHPPKWGCPPILIAGRESGPSWIWRAMCDLWFHQNSWIFISCEPRKMADKLWTKTGYLAVYGTGESPCHVSEAAGVAVGLEIPPPVAGWYIHSKQKLTLWPQETTNTSDIPKIWRDNRNRKPWSCGVKKKLGFL